MRYALAIALLSGCSRFLGLDSPEHQDAGGAGDSASDSQGLDDASNDSALPATCPSTYNVVTGTSTTRYRFDSSNKGWGNAQANCLADQPSNSSRHTHLAVVSSDGELAAIHTAVSNQEVWIGLGDSITNNTYLWVTDEAVNYPPLSNPPWAAGEPGGSAGENCVKLDPNGLLQDQGCGNNRAFICECDDYPNDPTHYQ